MSMSTDTSMSSLNPVDAIHELPDLLVEAGSLKEQFERRNADRARMRKGGTVFYVIDNDVIINITAPWKIHQIRPSSRASTRKHLMRKRHYLKNLIEDDSRAQQALNHILGEYFSRRPAAAKSIPFLLLEPGEAELKGLWNEVFELAGREESSLEQEYAEVHAILSFEHGITKMQRDQVERLVDRLVNCLREGPLVELQRIVSLQEAENILPADRVVDNNEALLPVPDAAARKQIAELEKDWLDRIDRQRPSKRRVGADERDPWPTNNYVDAAVLARVGWINSQFESQATDPAAAQRLCLITGDSTLEYLANKKVLRSSETFARHYLRSPTCFLADPEFFEHAGVETPQFLARLPAPAAADGNPVAAEGAIGQPGGRSFAHWVMMVFPKIDKEPMRLEQQVALAAKQARLEWAAYLRGVASIERLVEFDQRVQEQDDAVKSDFKLSNDQTRLRLLQLQEAMREVSKAAMTRFSAAGLLAGFWSIPSSRRWPSRVPPVIKFESLPKTREFVRRLQALGTLDDAQTQLDREAINELERAEDGTGYTRYMVFALAFALAGEWRSAYTVARAALSVAETYDRKKWRSSTVKGDEAAYLCSVCRLLSAARIEDLYESEQFLRMARERQLAAPWSPSLEGLANRDAYRDPRFEAAQLAIEISRLHFKEFKPRKPSDSVDLREHLSAYRAQSPRELCDRHVAVLLTVDRESEQDVRRMVKQQLAMSFLQLQLFAKLKNDASSLMPEQAGRMIVLLQECFPAGEQGTKMPIMVRLVFLCASALFLPEAAWGADKDPRWRELKEVQKAFAQTLVMPYDELRAAKWVELAEAALNASGDGQG